MKTEITEKLSFPAHLDIEISSFCQLRCIGCPYQFMTRPKGFMSIETFNLILEQSRGKSQSCYLHQFGEPLLHPQVSIFVYLAKKSGLFVSMSTNGQAMTETALAGLIDAGLDNLIVSVDAITENTYRKMRPGGDFSALMRNTERAVRLIKKRKLSPSFLEIQAVVTRDNVGELERFREFWEEELEGYGRVILKPYVTWAGTLEDRCPKSSTQPFVCTMLNYSMSIYWNGDVVVCCHDWKAATKMGNIHEQSIQEIWDSATYEELRKAHKDRNLEKLGFCAGCYKNPGG